MSVAEVLFDSMHVWSRSPRFWPVPLLKHLAAVQADREKELKAVQEAEVCRQEAAAREKLLLNIKRKGRRSKGNSLINR
jgi:hypothetical protein